MKKTTKILAGSALAITIALGAAAFAACDTSQPTHTTEETPQQMYGFSAATAGMVISGLNEGSAQNTMSAAAANLSVQVTDEQTIATLNNYMELVEGLLAENGFNITSGDNTQAGYEQYSKTMTVTYTAIDGEQLSYTAYYNEKLSYSGRDDDDDDEYIEVYFVQGVMLIDGAVYPMEGTFSKETEGRETEETQLFKVTLNEENGEYITVIRESENENGETETEYVYSIYSLNRLVNRVSFEMESERGETEISMETEDAVSNTRSYFEFEREQENGRDCIKITTGNKEYRVTISEGANGETQYIYHDANGREVGKGHRRNAD